MKLNFITVIQSCVARLMDILIKFLNRNIFITKCYLIQIGSVLLSFNLIIYFQKHTIQAWRWYLIDISLGH